MPSFTDLSNRLTIIISRHASLVFKNENIVFDIHRYCQQKKFDCQTMGEGKFHHCFSNSLFASFYIIWTKLDWLWSILMRIPNDKLDSNQWVWQYFNCDSKPLKAYTVQEQEYACSLENVHTVWYTYKYNKTQKSSGSESSILKLM